VYATILFYLVEEKVDVFITRPNLLETHLKIYHIYFLGVMLPEKLTINDFLLSLFFAFTAVILSASAICVFFKKRQIQLKSAFNFYKLKYEEEILKTQLEIQEHTFQKISREIHDNISLGLTLAKLQTTTYIELKDKDPKLLEFSIDLISKSLMDLNDISKSLDANQLITHGLIKALESEVNVLNNAGLYKIEMIVEGDPQYLASETDLILLRIFQESCNNILKHAIANEIILRLQYDKNFLTMTISDNGIGFVLEEEMNKKEIRKKSGLNNIVSRAKLIKAEVEITSAKGKGTNIKIVTPIKSNENG
jgi:two-component system NarL family sensor kinase